MRRTKDLLLNRCDKMTERYLETTGVAYDPRDGYHQIETLEVSKEVKREAYILYGRLEELEYLLR